MHKFLPFSDHKPQNIGDITSPNSNILIQGSVPSHAQSSGTLEEETSDSVSQPQAASTPTPSKRRRPRKRTDILKKDPSTPLKTTKLGSPGRTPMPDRNLALPLTPTSTQSLHPSKGIPTKIT